MKTMTLLVLTAVTLMPSSFAKKQSAEKRIVDRQSYDSYPIRSKKDAVNSCESKLAGVLKNTENGLDNLFEKSFEYECKEIEISSVTDFDTVGHVGSFSRGWAAVDHKYTIQITVSCVPRKLSEKALFAMAKRCEENPTAACFDDALLSKLDAIGTTKFSYKHKGSRCKPLN